MNNADYIPDFGDPGLAQIIEKLRGAGQDLQQHFHSYAPGRSLTGDLMLYCDCGNQVNCSAWKSAVGSGILHWNKYVIELGAIIIREKKGRINDRIDRS